MCGPCRPVGAYAARGIHAARYLRWAGRQGPLASQRVQSLRCDCFVHQKLLTAQSLTLIFVPSSTAGTTIPAIGIADLLPASLHASVVADAACFWPSS
jgi:hypothetical protein